ncbi:hypothetical protein MTX19_38335 [Bradyrhizobium sp. ISRA464]|nr:hypothetical protein MTX19_38335 [Bradyrhizobium sp. ISRA464]
MSSSEPERASAGRNAACCGCSADHTGSKLRKSAVKPITSAATPSTRKNSRMRILRDSRIRWLLSLTSQIVIFITPSEVFAASQSWRTGALARAE